MEIEFRWIRRVFIGPGVLWILNDDGTELLYFCGVLQQLLKYILNQRSRILATQNQPAFERLYVAISPVSTKLTTIR